MKRPRFPVLLATLMVLYAVVPIATQLSIMIAKGADEGALLKVWSNYTTFWSANDGNITTTQFFEAFPKYQPITDASIRERLCAATDAAWRDQQGDPKSIHQVLAFSAGQYQYVIASDNKVPTSHAVFPCYLVAFDKGYKLMAVFRG